MIYVPGRCAGGAEEGAERGLPAEVVQQLVQAVPLVGRDLVPKGKGGSDVSKISSEAVQLSSSILFTCPAFHEPKWSLLQNIIYRGIQGLFISEKLIQASNGITVRKIHL